eukprot:tig00020629_g12446.t1
MIPRPAGRPVLSGCEATERIRALEAARGLAPCRIVALTGHAGSEELEACLRSGMDKVLFFYISFPFLSFPFLSFPFLYFPFLSFTFLSFPSLRHGSDKVLTKPIRKAALLAELAPEGGTGTELETLPAGGPGAGARMRSASVRPPSPPAAGACGPSPSFSNLCPLAPRAPSSSTSSPRSGRSAGVGAGAARRRNVLPPLAIAAPASLDSLDGATPSGTARGCTPLRILVVDDVEMNRRVLTALLRRMGHATAEAKDGEEALEMLRPGPGTPGPGARTPFDLVLSDIAMPRCDGLAMAQRLRQMEDELGMPRTPLVACTAFGSPSDREASLAAGLDEHVVKPITRAALLPVLRRFGGLDAGPAPAPAPAAGLCPGQ